MLLLFVMITSACRFVFVPSQHSSFRVSIVMDLNHNELWTIGNTTITAAVITTTEPMQQHVNSSFCHIASLEVYRGRRQITEISHEGFSLSERGTVQVIDTLSLHACTDSILCIFMHSI